MFKKQVVAIACSGVFGVGAVGSALAAEDTAGQTAQQTGSGSGVNDSQSTQSQQSSQSDSTTGQVGSANKDDAMAQGGQTSSNGAESGSQTMAGKEIRNKQGEVVGHAAGVVVDAIGQVQAYVVRTDQAQRKGGKSDDGADSGYILVPAEAVQSQSQQAPQTGTMAQSQSPNQGSQGQSQNETLTRQERALVEMYQLLEKQQREIRLLRQQLQHAGMQSNGDAIGGGQAANHAQGNPLSQVDQVILDRYGRVQAVVLDSGVVLSPGGSAGMGLGQGQAGPGSAQARSGSGQRQQAIILFDPSKQQDGSQSGSSESASSASASVGAGSAGAGSSSSDDSEQQSASQ